MEQRNFSLSPRSKSKVRQTRPKNTTQQHRDPHLSASVPSSATVLSLHTSANLRDEDVSVSEPSLRFPRPQGNKRLANWISSSNPNIMNQLETGSEPGLAGSTYELINKEDTSPNAQHIHTDSESQDDSQHDFDGSMSESIGSLDQFRPDDVQSLTSTDHIEDEEDDGFQHHYDDYQDDVSTNPDEEASRLTDLTMVNQRGDVNVVHSAAEENQEQSDAESRSSIEYTRQSLGTPSILTPEASKILCPGQDGFARAPMQTIPDSTGDRALEGTWIRSKDAISKLSESVTSLVPSRPAQADRKAWGKFRQEHWFASEFWQAVDILRDNPRQIAVSILTIILATFILGYSDSLRSGSSPALDPISVETSTTTTTVVVESTILVPPAETERPLHTSTGVALIPLHESHGDEGLFGYSMPTVFFEPEGESGILINVRPSIPKTWTAQRECVRIHALRGQQNVPLNVNFTSPDTIHVEFGKAEAHGIVQIKLSSKCRPKFEKSVKVHFGKGVIEQMLACVGELAHVLTSLPKSQLSNVERCKAFKSMSYNVDRTLSGAKDKSVEVISSQFDTACRVLGPLGDSVVRVSQEAGRRLHQAEEALTAVSDRTRKPLSTLRTQTTRIAEDSFLNAGQLLAAVRAKVASSAKSAFEKAALSQRAHQANLKKAVSDIQIAKLQERARFGLLDAQVSAKTWWLKMKGQEDQSREYSRRAKEFIAELHAFSTQEAATLQRGKARAHKPQCGNQCKSRCKSNGASQGRTTQQCVPAA